MQGGAKGHAKGVLRETLRECYGNAKGDAKGALRKSLEKCYGKR